MKKTYVMSSELVLVSTGSGCLPVLWVLLHVCLLFLDEFDCLGVILSMRLHLCVPACVALICGGSSADDTFCLGPCSVASGR